MQAPAGGPRPFHQEPGIFVAPSERRLIDSLAKLPALVRELIALRFQCRDGLPISADILRRREECVSLLACSLKSSPSWSPGYETSGELSGYDSGQAFMGTCPDCGSQLEYAEGCVKCHVCGFSECG